MSDQKLVQNFICFWKNLETSENIEKISNPQILANAMFEISHDSKYAHSRSDFQRFAEAVFVQQKQSSSDIFFASIILEVENQIVGFLNANIVYDTIDIDFICISPSYRKHGFGETIYKYFEKKLKEEFVSREHYENYKVMLEVSEKNLPAIHFYKKIGFYQIGIREKYYFYAEDAVTMEKNYIFN